MKTFNDLNIDSKVKTRLWNILNLWLRKYCFSRDMELDALVKAINDAGGKKVFLTLRNIGEGMWSALEEAISQAEPSLTGLLKD